MRAEPGRSRRAVVVANGVGADLAPFRPLVQTADLVVAADGGARLLLAQGLRPHVILGDMDSVPASLLADWRAAGGETLTFPAEKDETDLELALAYAIGQGAQRIAILGALGGRIDHEMANLLLLAAPALAEAEVAVLDTRARVMAVRAAAQFQGRVGDTLSLLPLTASVDGIVTEGLHYALHGETLLLGPARGVSNVFVADRVTIRVGAGLLLAVHTWSEERVFSW
jgi:thiamine pyrophosphokinase